MAIVSHDALDEARAQGRAEILQEQSERFGGAVKSAIEACNHCAMEGRKVGEPAYYVGWEQATKDLIDLLATWPRAQQAAREER